MLYFENLEGGFTEFFLYFIVIREWQQNGLIIDQSLKAIKKAINEAGFTVEEVLSPVEGSKG